LKLFLKNVLGHVFLDYPRRIMLTYGGI